MPANENLYLTAGNKATCTIQGMAMLMTNLGIASYYSILSIYSYLAILNKFDESKLRRFEPFFHAVSIVWPLGLTIYGAAKNFFNPLGPFCHVTRSPPQCSGKTCYHDDISLYETVNLMTLAAVILNATIMSIFIYMLEKRKEIANSSLRGKEQLREELKRKKIKAVAHQTSLYVLSVYVTYGISFFTRALQMSKEDIPFPAAVYATIIISLQGVVNTIVYELTRSRKVIIICTNEKDGNQRQNKNTILLDERPVIVDTNYTEHYDSDSQNSIDDMTYSIFDGRRSSNNICMEFTFEDDLRRDLERDLTSQHSHRNNIEESKQPESEH